MRRVECLRERCQHYLGYEDGETVLDACMLARYVRRDHVEECPADREERILNALDGLKGLPCPGRRPCPAKTRSGEWLPEYCEGCPTVGGGE